jgi:hypothetical protein
MACSDEDRGRSRRPGAEDRKWSHRSGTQRPGDREVGWRRVRSAPCMWRRGARVSWLSLKTKFDVLLVAWPQNHSDGFWWFGLKTCCDGFLQFGLKTSGDYFLQFDLKTGGDDFLQFGLKTGDDGFSRFGLKTGGRFLG